MIGFIMRLFGYEDIRNIIIKRSFKKRPPREYKLKWRRAYYEKYKNFFVPIVLCNHNHLIDGYTSYLIAKEKGIKYVKVERR